MPLETCEDGFLYSDVCWSQPIQLDVGLRTDIARHLRLKTLQKLKHQLRSKLLQMTCASAVLVCCRKTSVRSVTMNAVDA